MIDFQNYRIDDAIKCYCGFLIPGLNTEATDRNGLTEILIKCPKCHSEFVFLLRWDSTGALCVPTKEVTHV